MTWRSGYAGRVAYKLLLVIGLALVVGCGRPVISPRLHLLDSPLNPVYSDRDWAQVVSVYVHDGLVDYDGLVQNRDSLERYYALLSVTGPTRTPTAFTSANHATAYWINAFNALVLRAVLDRYPTTTMHTVGKPRLLYDYRFQVDGRQVNLAWIEKEILKVSNQDVRGLFATCRAAMGSPRLPPEPMDPRQLDRQLTRAAAEGLDLGRGHLLRIDHGDQAIQAWLRILDLREAFLDYWRIRRRSEFTQLLNVLMELTSPDDRRRLQSAVGYAVVPMPFDRRLNRWPSAGSISQVP